MESGMTNNFCIYHPQSQGVAFCKRCNGHICRECIIVVEGKGYCKKCHQDAQKQKAASKKCINHPDKLGSAYCKKCGGYICDECLIVISNKQFCKKCYNEHLLKSASIVKCINHPEITGEIFCEQCNGYLCNQCIVTLEGKKFCKKHNMPSNSKTPNQKANGYEYTSESHNTDKNDRMSAKKDSPSEKKSVFNLININSLPAFVYGFILILLGIIQYTPPLFEYTPEILTASWIVSILFALYWGSRRDDFDADQVDLPSTFLELNFHRRKQALDFAWIVGYKTISSLPIESISRSVQSGAVLYVAIFIGIFDFMLIILRILAEEQYEPFGIYLLYIVFLSLPILILHYYYTQKRLAEQAAMIEEAEQTENETLKRLGRLFVHKNCGMWVEEIDKLTKLKAVSEIQSNPEIDFTLLSASISFSPSDMPAPKLGVTYIFSNGFVSVVSNIIFNLKETSYSYTSSNTPTFVFNSPDEWSTEEFHYRDVVEINYSPAPSASNIVVAKNSEYPVEGLLTLSLVNASQKAYPTTKNCAASFITLAREKVRSAKRNSSS